MKDWKTTVFGALLSVGIAVQPLLTTGKVDWKAVVIAALVAVVTYFAGDKNSGNGTKPTTATSAN